MEETSWTLVILILILIDIDHDDMDFVLRSLYIFIKYMFESCVFYSHTIYPVNDIFFKMWSPICQLLNQYSVNSLCSTLQMEEDSIVTISSKRDQLKKIRKISWIKRKKGRVWKGCGKKKKRKQIVIHSIWVISSDLNLALFTLVARTAAPLKSDPLSDRKTLPIEAFVQARFQGMLPEFIDTGSVA